MIFLSCLLLGCGNDDEETDEIALDKKENVWGVSVNNDSNTVLLTSDGGSITIKTDSAMYLRALGEYNARGAEGWNNVFVFDTIYSKYGDPVYCKDGPRECDVYGVKVNYISHNEVYVTVSPNTSEKERRLVLDYAPIGKYSDPVLFWEAVFIVQEGNKD